MFQALSLSLILLLGAAPSKRRVAGPAQIQHHKVGV